MLAFIRCILHPSKNPQDLESKLKKIVGKYENYEGWKILTSACSTYLASKNSLPEASVLLKLLNVDFNFAQADQIEPFEDLEEMKSWLENYQNQNGTNLEERLRNAVQKSKKDKCTKIVTSLSTILEKLKLAENNPLSLDRRSIQAISDLNGKLANLRNFFKQPFLDALLQRHSNLVEIFDIKIQAETKLNQNKSNSSNLVERKMSFYTQIKDSIEAKKLGNEGLDKILKSKIEALTSANNIVLWAEEALSGIKAILRVDVKHLIDDKDGVLQEAANWKTQAQTRLLQLEEIESSKDTADYVKDQLRKVLELASSIDQKIEDTADTEKEAKIQAFQAKEQLIANQLQTILLALQGIKIEGSSLEAIEKASQNVEKILDDCEKLEAEKNEYVQLGNVVKDYLKSVDSIKDICNKWERVTNLLRDQKIKSQSLIQMWNQSENLKKSFEMDMNKFEETFPDKTEIIEDGSMLTQVQEEYKSSIDVLRKMRHNFEMFFKCQKQLIHEMQTVPSFDTSQLKKDLTNLQQRYAELCTNQKEKSFHLQKLITTWNNVQKEMDLLEDLKQSLTHQNSVNLIKVTQELSNLSQHAEKVVESLESEVLPKVNLNIVFIQNTLKNYKKKILQFLQDSENQEIIEELLKSTQNIDKSFAQIKQQKNQNYNDFKSHLQMLNSLKDTIEKISTLKNLETNATLDPFTSIYLNKCEENVRELMNELKSVQDLDLNETEINVNINGDLNIMKSILTSEIPLFEAYFNLDPKPDLETNVQDLKIVQEVIGNLEQLNIKSANVGQVDDLKEQLDQISILTWKEVITEKVNKIRQMIEENSQKAEENSEMKKMLQSLENDIIESELMRDNVKKYGKLSAISWKFPRPSELEQSSSNQEKMFQLFSKFVEIMQSDLTKSLNSISDDNDHWLKSWLQASIDEMCLNEPCTDITQVVQSLDQTLILLNSANYAQLCLRNHRNWNGKIQSIKSLLLNENDDFTWLEKIAKAESGLNELFDQASTKPIQPEDVVLLSTIDEMCNKLDKLMNDYRNFLAQLRYFEEKAQELKITLENSKNQLELDLISNQEKDLTKNLMNINQLASQLELCHLLKHINELMLEIQKLIKDKKSSDEIIEKIVNRTEELAELGIEDEDFESKATQLLQDLNDQVLVNLTEHQNEQMTSCLDEVTSLLEEFEAQTNLNSDMLEIAQLHEELTNWLKDVEDALQKSLDLKSSLDDKKKQLEEYHEIHNDIEAHEKLVSMVFEKTSKLMTQTNDFSLSAYLSSIQSLFETIKSKSWKLIQQMGECIEEQEDYEDRLVNFTDFLTAQAQYLKEILSVKTHNPGFDPKAELSTLLQRIEDGNSMLMDLEDTLADVIASTSEEGKEGLEIEFKQISLMWTKHLKQIQDLKGSLESVQTSFF